MLLQKFFLANIGGSATLVGDPPNVILGLKLGFYFNDFVIHNGPIALVAGAVTLLYCYGVSKKSIIPTSKIKIKDLSKMNPKDALKDIRQLKIALIAFGVAVLFLITHIYIEKYWHIPLTVPLAVMIPAFVMLVFFG